MSVDRLERVNVLVRREIAEAIPAVMSNAGIDLASVMVSNVRVASNLRNATVSISILGHEKERGSILSAFRSKRNEFQKLINRDIDRHLLLQAGAELLQLFIHKAGHDRNIIDQRFHGDFLQDAPSFRIVKDIMILWILSSY